MIHLSNDYLCILFTRKSGEDNPFRCTYVLPDGVTHTKGYVKDMEEARRYLSLPSQSTINQSVANEELDCQENAKRPEARRQIDLTKNVLPQSDYWLKGFICFCSSGSHKFFCAGVFSDKWALPCAWDDFSSFWSGSVSP